jgi:hypothetical protein
MTIIGFFGGLRFEFFCWNYENAVINVFFGTIWKLDWGLGQSLNLL